MSYKQCQRRTINYQVDVVLLQHLDCLTEIKNVQTMICVVMQLNSCTLWMDTFLKLNVFCIDMSESHNLQSSAVDRGFEPLLGQTEDYKIGICCFSAKHTAMMRKIKTGWLGIRIICPSESTCLPMDCCFSELALYKSNSACCSSTKRTSSSSH